MTKKIAAISLGCKLNFSETSWIMQQFENAGYERVHEDSNADVFIINTCTVTELANKKSRQAIHKIINKNMKLESSMGYKTNLFEDFSSNIMAKKDI